MFVHTLFEIDTKSLLLQLCQRYRQSLFHDVTGEFLLFDDFLCQNSNETFSMIFKQCVHLSLFHFRLSIYVKFKIKMRQFV